MGEQRFERASELPFSAERAFAWHARPGAFERLTPPFDPVRVVERTGGLEVGSRAVAEVRIGPLTRRWVAEHTECEPGRRFVDVQREGPFAAWEHTHAFLPLGPERCRMTDSVRYRLPLGPLGAVGGGYVRAKLERLFDWRQATVLADLERHAGAAARSDGAALDVAISGASGLVGSALAPFLTTGGHRVRRLVRREARGPDEVRWDPPRGGVDAAGLAGVDAVVHLAGEGIADGRWTDDRKRRIRESRVDGTRTLCEALATLEAPPRVLVAASAVGCYGDRGDEPLDHASTLGGDFLADVARDWEAACEPARAAGVRVVHARFGVILDPRGGALGRMLPIFRLGGGGPVGSGRQWWSWVSIEDVVGALHRALTDDALAGPMDTVAPEPVTSREFAGVLGRVLGRPAVLPAPAFALRALFGEMADAALLASQRVRPTRLLDAGFGFRHPDLETALRALLGRTGKGSGTRKGSGTLG